MNSVISIYDMFSFHLHGLGRVNRALEIQPNGKMRRVENVGCTAIHRCARARVYPEEV